MATLTPEAMADLIKSTLADLDRNAINQFATTLQNYEVMGKLLRSDRTTFHDGRKLQWNMMTDHAHSARSVGLYEKDSLNVGDYLQTAEAPWRFLTDNWAYEYREALMNRGSSRIVDELAARKAASLISTAEALEAKFWDCPVDSEDVLEPFGIYYWITKHATEGFYGGNNLIYTSGRGGLSSGTYARYKNWTGQYVNVTKNDLIKKMRKAYEYCQWKMPTNVATIRSGEVMNRIYCAYATLAELETVGESQNENLGRDIASMDGKILFRGMPVVWVPYLDNDTDLPVFMLNMNDFQVATLEGDYLRTTGPIRADEYHNVFAFHTDLTYQFIAKQLRTHAVLSKSIAYPTSLYE